MLPIYKKKGDKSLPIDYRPISLTSVVGKLMETIIRDKLVTFLEGNMKNNSQHGFAKQVLRRTTKGAELIQFIQM